MEKKFYLVEIATGDSKIAGKGIYEYSTEKEAIANFHKKLGVAMGSDLYTSDLIMVIAENGRVVKKEKYVAEIVEAEEATE